MRFKQLVVTDKTYDLHTIEYAYDNLSRLTEARYNPGTNLETSDGDLLRRYLYTFDLAGNRRTEQMWVNGSPTANITYDYNAANQLIDDGTYTYEYDGNGNLRYKKLIGTPVETYTWNRANRLVTWDNGTPADLLNYRYDGLNNRISRSLGTTSPIVTQYLLDLQPGLSVVLAATVDTDVTRYVHGPMGIHAQEDPAGAWSWMTQDGLGSVRGVVDNSVAVAEVRQYGQFGDQIPGAPYDYAASVYGFTGEVTEIINPLVHLRARDYNPALGVFTALDPFEGTPSRPMSLNGYSWVEGNVPNAVDPSGLFFGFLSTIKWAKGALGIASYLSSGMCDTKFDFRAKQEDECSSCGNIFQRIGCRYFNIPCQPSAPASTGVQPTDPISVINSGDTAASICFTEEITGASTFASQACQDYFGLVAATGREPTYQELMAMLIYTEFDTIGQAYGTDSEIYNLLLEAITRQYYEIAGSDGRFDNYQELFRFLGGIEGWYGHEPTVRAPGTNRMPLTWIFSALSTGTLPAEATEYERNIAGPRIRDAYGRVTIVWNGGSWGGEDWRGYGDCTQPATWGNVTDLNRSYISYVETPGGGIYPYFIVQASPGCS